MGNVPVEVLTCAYRSESVRIGERSEDANPIEIKIAWSVVAGHTLSFSVAVAGYSLVGVLELCAHRHNAV